MQTAKTKRVYDYHIHISFKGSVASHWTGKKTGGYSGSQNHKDKFSFYQKSISLVLSRSKKYEDGAILSNANNSVNSQIIKSLLCYYAITKDFPLINRVTIIRKQARKPDYIYTETDSLIQPIASRVQRIRSYPPETLDGLLEDTQRGQTLRVAMSYWLKGIASDDEYYKFEHLWRAFNRLFMYYGGSAKEFDNMVAMREFVLLNSAIFKKSINVTNSYSEQQLSEYRWSRLLLNDYDTQSKTKALRDFILRYNDRRIMKVFKEKLVCRKANLISEGLWAEVNSHINSNLSTRVDTELVTLIALKYSYFVRNKLFHGEVLDGTFKISHNNQDEEIHKLNDLLEVVVFEIMESYQSLRI